MRNGLFKMTKDQRIINNVHHIAREKSSLIVAIFDCKSVISAGDSNAREVVTAKL